MKTYDAHYILVNLAHDIDRMTRENISSKTIYNLITKKIRFLSKPPEGSKIKWD